MSKKYRDPRPDDWEPQFDDKGEEIIDGNTYPIGIGLPTEPTYVDVGGVKVLLQEIRCVLCGAAFRSPQSDMSYSKYGMDFKYTKRLPREVAKLCPSCWKSVYIGSRVVENVECQEKAIEFIRIMGSEAGKSGQDHQKLVEDQKKFQEDQVRKKWIDFCKERDKDK
jgi:hypothetical protein